MEEGKKERKVVCQGASGGVYGLAFLGALYFYLQGADSFSAGAVGVFKALIWPAILVYKLLVFLA